MTGEVPIYAPPPHPPPLLSPPEIHDLAIYGFLRLSSLPPTLTSAHQDLLDRSSTFFNQETSAKEHQFPAAEGTELGYYLVEHEKEYVTLRCHNDVEPPATTTTADTNQNFRISTTVELQQASAHFWKLAAKLLHRILCDLSTALCIPLDAWNSLLDGCLAMPEGRVEMTPSLLRLFRYEPRKGGAERHTDTGLLTLCIGTAAGLQVWTPPPPSSDGEVPRSLSAEDGTWEDVGNTPTVLVGKTLQWLSANRVRGGVHRVVPHEKGRQSIVLALRPSLRHPRLDLTPFGEPQVVDLGEVWRRIRASVFNVNAKVGVREGQKVKLGIKTAEVGKREDSEESESTADSEDGSSEVENARNGGGKEGKAEENMHSQRGFG
ncbi:MAG: hypothetical protein Q9220_000749 [cf. Caloplaca sp. 1 TL-2023]